MTVPIGIHNPLFPRIIGMTPIEAAIDVRNIGLIRRWAEYIYPLYAKTSVVKRHPNL